MVRFGWHKTISLSNSMAGSFTKCIEKALWRQIGLVLDKKSGFDKRQWYQYLILGTQHQYSITIKQEEETAPKPIQSTGNNTTSTQQYYSFRNAGQKHSSPLIRGRRKQTLTTQLESKVFLCLHWCHSCCFCQKRGTQFKTCFPLWNKGKKASKKNIVKNFHKKWPSTPVSYFWNLYFNFSLYILGQKWYLTTKNSNF